MHATLDEVVAKYAKAVDRLDALTARTLALLDDGDRVAYYLRADYNFLASANTPEDLNLNNPLDAMFYGTRLNLYLDTRLTDSSDSLNDEVTYRPDDWTGVNDWSRQKGFFEMVGKANCTFRIRLPRGEYSNAAINITNAFSMRYGVAGSDDGVIPVSAYIGGLDFHRPEPIKRGESMIVRVTPLYSGSRPTTGVDVRDFRITAVLQGYKVVHAFR